jgi:AcrR family transcriptional regulator
MTSRHDNSCCPPHGQRGPAEHQRREQIIEAADAYFRQFGYNKTTVADLAKSIGVSSAYVYRFFESKRSIGEAVCRKCLGDIEAALEDIAASEQSATMRLRRIMRVKFEQGLELFFKDRKLHDIVVSAVTEHWRPSDEHRLALLRIVTRTVSEGRAAGEFERKTPLDEVCRGIVAALASFTHPLQLEGVAPEGLEEDLVALTGLVLRSLSF